MAFAVLFDKFTKFVLITVLLLVPIMSHAGGLGIAPLVFILGIIGLIIQVRSIGVKSIIVSPVFLTLALFLLWACTTAIWSPYRPDDFLTNYIKLFIMGLIFYFCPVIFQNVARDNFKLLRTIIVVTTLIGSSLVVFDIWTNFSLTLFLHPAHTADEKIFRLIDSEMNLGHAITFLLLLSGPVSVLLNRQVKYGKILSIVFFILIVMAAWLNNLSVGIFGLGCVLISMILAYQYPRITPPAVLILGAMVILCSPVLSYFANQIPVSDLKSLPWSWEHRVRMWAYCWPVISESFMLGTGFDAVRTFSESFTTRNGAEMTIVSLHPHNVGIHIWTETGFIGALFASFAIINLIRPVHKYANSSAKTAAVTGLIMAVLVISSVTYGAWQFWWWGSVFFAIGILNLIK